MLSFEEWLSQVGVPQDKMQNSLLKKAMMKAYEEYRGKALEGKIEQRYEDISDFGSGYYDQYRQYLQGIIPHNTPESLLSPLAAGGFNYGTSQTLATERAKGLNIQRGEDIRRGTQEFALGSQSQAQGLLNTLLQNQQFKKELQQRKDEQPGFFESLLNMGGGLLGYGLGNVFSDKPFFGGGSSRGSSGIKSDPSYPPGGGRP